MPNGLAVCHDSDFIEIPKESLLLLIESSKEGEVYLCPEFSINITRMYLAENAEKEILQKRNAELLQVCEIAERMVGPTTKPGPERLALWAPLKCALRHAGFKVD